MNIISFDVGIKNMAYCIFSLTDRTINITKWDILNLMNDEMDVPQCTCLLATKKQSKPCNKKAQYKKGEQYYCKKHSQQQKEWLIPSPSHLVSIKKMKVDELRETIKKLNITSPETTRPSLLQTLQDYYAHHNLECVVESKKQKAQEIDLINIGQNMTKLLNQIPEIETVTHIIIENQISPIATRMKTIQGMLAQYFIMKRPTATIEFISSANKLKGFTVSDEKPSYKDNKKNSIVFCVKIIEQNPCFHEWRELLKTHKKTDDLYDACLQCIWYLKNKKRMICDSNFIVSLVSEQ
jgi:hypothetical protein